MTKTLTALTVASLLSVMPLVADAQYANNNANAGATASDYLSVRADSSGISYAPGTTHAFIGTITFTGLKPGSVQLTSVPFSLASANQAYLNGCQLIGPNGNALNTGSNVLNALSANNSITLDNPLTINYQSVTPLTLRCTVSSGAPYGSTFTIAPIMPTLVPSLGVAMVVFPSVNPGEVNAPLSALTLSAAASGNSVVVHSVNVNANFSGGLTPSELANCRVRSSGSSLTSNSSGAIVSGDNVLTFDSPITLGAGSAPLPLIVTCDVAGNAPVNGAVTLTVTPAATSATLSGSSTPVIAGSIVDPSSGNLEPTSGTTTVVTPGSSTNSNTPSNIYGATNVANTGLGGGAPLTFAVLLAALFAVAGGAVWLARSIKI